MIRESYARKFPSRKRGAGRRFSDGGEDPKHGVERVSDRNVNRPRTATWFHHAAQAWTCRGPNGVPSEGGGTFQPDGTPAGVAVYRIGARATSQGSTRGAWHPKAACRKPDGLVRCLAALCPWLCAPSPQDQRPISVKSAVLDRLGKLRTLRMSSRQDAKGSARWRLT
jgi:hypothetical protein